MDWIATTFEAIGLAIISFAGMYVCLIIYTRLSGLRSFSKISGFDFAVTVAIGSILASVVLTKDPPLLLGASLLASVFVIQMSVTYLRARIDWVESLFSNEPRLIMAHGEIIQEQMDAAKISVADLRAKLREANVLDFTQIEAVVAETTGDISVLHRKQGEARLNPSLLEGVIGAERYTKKPD